MHVRLTRNTKLKTFDSVYEQAKYPTSELRLNINSRQQLNVNI